MTKVEKAKAMEETAWTTDQYKAMVQHCKQDTDPRMAKDIAGLKAQWMQRKGRSSPTHLPNMDAKEENAPQLQQQQMMEEDLGNLGWDDEDAPEDAFAAI